MLNIDINMFPATCCRLQSAASLHLCWARNVKELMRPAATSWQANEFTLLTLPLWLPSNRSISSFVIFPCPCAYVCVSFLWVFTNVGVPVNVTATGKGWVGPKERYWRHGSAWDQVRGFCLLRHACGNRTVAVLSVTWCQIVSPWTPEKKGKLEKRIIIIIRNFLELTFFSSSSHSGISNEIQLIKWCISLFSWKTKCRWK